MPITVSRSQTVNLKRVKVQENKEELSKEEKRRLRAKNKRHLKSKLKSKELGKKEKMRAQGVANVGDRFLHKEIQTKIEAQKKADAKARRAGEQVGRESQRSG